MGGCVSVSLSCDQVVNQFSQWLCVSGSYIHNLSENLASLQKAMGVLKANRDDVIRRVEREEFTGRQQRLSQVQVWLTSVIFIQNQFDDLLSTNEVELQRLCLCGFCSKDLKLSYRYGKRISVLLKEAESLSSQGKFNVVTETASVGEVEEMPLQPTIVGQETMLERVWNRLMEDRVGILGLYGMGGVGKTTLLRQINNKFSEIGGFDVVIWVVVSRVSEIRKIQGDIAKKLGLLGEEWDQKNENQRALDIHNVLKRRKFVLLLDDIWEKVNLQAVGVPYPSKENGSMVAFTTRSRSVCGRMGVENPIEVSCLEPDKAWDLFKKKIGENTMGSHPDIPELARKVAGKCRGLPLALNVIGETMACKNTVQEWRHAIDILTSSATEFSGMEDEILPILKYSYNSLNGELVKSCFLYCSLFPEDYQMVKEDLIDYWISEGFIDEKEGRYKAVNQGYEILSTLIHACLLLEEGNEKSVVKMHDVVRDMALWIASDLGEHKERCIVQAGVGLLEVPKVKNWNKVRRMSLMGNEIEKISESHDCSELRTLFLQRNYKLVTILGDFFQSMSKLVVLDLSWTSNLSGFPDEISELVSLRYLNLSCTNIVRLPIVVLELKTLIHLNLKYTRRLESITGISKLSSLKTLGLLHSKVSLDLSLLQELQSLKCLEVVTTVIRSSLVMEQLLYAPRMVKCIQGVSIKGIQEESFRVLTLPTMANLCLLMIWTCGMREIKIEMDQSFTNPCFPNLSSVVIRGCDGLKDLTWLLFAQNLTYLEVDSLKQLEDIISEEKAKGIVAEEDEGLNTPFQKLEYLGLRNLPTLKSIYWSPLLFPHLNEIVIQENCLELRKLPLDSRSGVTGEELVIRYKEKEWMERVVWEDEATQLRFLPSCKLWR